MQENKEELQKKKRNNNNKFSMKIRQSKDQLILQKVVTFFYCFCCFALKGFVINQNKIVQFNFFSLLFVLIY